VIFTRTLDDGLASLVRAADKFVAENKAKGMTSFVVLLEEPTEASKAKLVEFAKSNNISIPLTIPAAGARGPESYRLNPRAKVTVLVARRKVVKANFALAGSPTRGDTEAVLKAAREMLGD